MGVPSCGLCWLHNSGVSTPSLFSQSKINLGLTLNQLEISFTRPNLNATFFPLPLPPPNLHTDSYITAAPISLDAQRRADLFLAAREVQGASYEFDAISRALFGNVGDSLRRSPLY